MIVTRTWNVFKAELGIHNSYHKRSITFTCAMLCRKTYASNNLIVKVPVFESTSITVCKIMNLFINKLSNNVTIESEKLKFCPKNLKVPQYLKLTRITVSARKLLHLMGMMNILQYK